MKRILFGVIIVIILSMAAVSGDIPTAREYTNSIGMKMVRIEPGTFQMGQLTLPLPPQVLVEPQSPAGSYDFLSQGDYDERPIHKVKITQPFYMGICEVTNYQYELFDREHKQLRSRDGFSRDDDEAVIYVNWYDAQAFCRWLSDKESLPYRLATEAEWEYACRAGTTTNYNTGDTLPAEMLKHAKRTEGPPRVSLHVGKTVPNGWGLYDMHGNVEEWCYDWYGPYQDRMQRDPVGRISGNFRVTRGGSAGTKPFCLRTANRMGMMPEDKHW
ncbi:MAG: formylglycine-generating enzyme family protein, partial [Planctomycetota bacterium]